MAYRPAQRTGGPMAPATSRPGRAAADTDQFNPDLERIYDELAGRQGLALGRSS